MVNTPMNASFIDAADAWQATRTLKEDIVLLDPDLTSQLDISKISLPPGARLVELSGLSRQEVIKLYKQAKVVVDSYITGMERAIFESALFHVVPLVAKHGNAREPLDFVLPEAWLWQAHDYGRLNKLIALALSDHAAAVADMEPLRQYVRNMPAAFSEQVRRYFQDDVHIMIPALGPVYGEALGQHATAAMSALILAMHFLPFSTQELVTWNTFYLEFEYANIFRDLHEHNEAHSTTTAPLLAEYTRFGPMAAYLQPPRALHHRDFILILPPGSVPVHPDLAAAMFRQAFRSNLSAVFGPDGLMMVQQAHYYPVVQRLLPLLPSRLDLRDLQQLLGEAGLQVLRLSTISSKQPCQVPLLFLNSDSDNKPSSSCYCHSLTSALRGYYWQMYGTRLSSASDSVLQKLEKLHTSC